MMQCSSIEQINAYLKLDRTLRSQFVGLILQTYADKHLVIESGPRAVLPNIHIPNVGPSKRCSSAVGRHLRAWRSGKGELRFRESGFFRIAAGPGDQ